MKYIDINDAAIKDSYGYVSLRLLKQYCDIAPYPVRFIGNMRINTIDYRLTDEKTRFNNLVYAANIMSSDICLGFPDLVSAGYLEYFVSHDTQLDICNLRKAHRFTINKSNSFGSVFIIDILRNQIKIINDDTLIINGKELIVEDYWGFFGIVNRINYKRSEFYKQ